MQPSFLYINFIRIFDITNEQINEVTMHPKFLFILVMTLTINSAWSQTAFNPFKLQTSQHSSFHGKVATVSSHSSVEETNTTASEDVTNNATSSSEKDNATQENELIEPLLDFNGNEIPKLDASLSQAKGGNLVKITVIFENQDFGCQNDLKLTLGFDEFSVSSSETNLFLTEGKYYYKVEGRLACKGSDDSQVAGEGIIEIKANDKLELKWQLIDYQQSWMVLDRK